MSAGSSKHVVRMGPITVLALVIVLSLATMAVLSFATAQAALRTVDRQESAVLSLYANEQEAQEFVARVDAGLVTAREKRQATGEAMQTLAQYVPGATIEGSVVSESFTHGTRTLNVKLRVEDDLSYTIDEWKTSTDLGVREEASLWQGNQDDAEPAA